MAMEREWLEKDYYAVLGVADSATDKEITKAYRKLARQLHPDANPGDRTAEERFKELSGAYEVLGDPAKRKEYDQARRLGPMAAGFGQGAGAGGFDVRVDNLDNLGDLGGIDDLLGGLFGTRGATWSRSARPRRGADLEAELHLSFEDAVRGVTTTLPVTTDVHCSTCAGSGALLRRGGAGQILGDACPSCGGTGTEWRTSEVKVRVPAGVDDGQTVRIRGRGRPGPTGGPAGDLLVHVRVAPHRLFGRKGSDLTLEVPITFPEAVLGAEIKVPTLDGAPVTLRIPAGTPSGRTFRVRGRGVGDDKGAGDLLVTVHVTVPERLSAQERPLVEALAEATTESPRRLLEV